MFRRIFLSLIVLAAVGSTLPVAQAQEPYPGGQYGAQVQPLDRILPNVRNGRPGRFYDAEGPFPDAAGGYHYRIKWLTPGGRVIWLDADARSGRVLGVARGDWRGQGPPPFGAMPPPPPGDRFGAPYGPGPDRAFGRPYGRPGGPGRGPFGGWRGSGGRGRGH